MILCEYLLIIHSPHVTCVLNFLRYLIMNVLSLHRDGKLRRLGGKELRNLTSKFRKVGVPLLNQIRSKHTEKVDYN